MLLATACVCMASLLTVSATGPGSRTSRLVVGHGDRSRIEWLSRRTRDG